MTFGAVTADGDMEVGNDRTEGDGNTTPRSKTTRLMNDVCFRKCCVLVEEFQIFSSLHSRHWHCRLMRDRKFDSLKAQMDSFTSPQVISSKGGKLKWESLVPNRLTRLLRRVCL